MLMHICPQLEDPPKLLRTWTGRVLLSKRDRVIGRCRLGLICHVVWGHGESIRTGPDKVEYGAIVRAIVRPSIWMQRCLRTQLSEHIRPLH